MSRAPRFNMDAEASVLGGLLLKPQVLIELPTLEVEDFYHHQHKVVFEAMRNLDAAQKPIDIVTVETEVKKRGKLDAIGGNAALLGELSLRVPTVDNIIAYTAIIQADAQIRRLAVTSTDIAAQCYDPAADAEELVTSAIAQLSMLGNTKVESGGGVGDLVKRRVREFEELWAAQARNEHVWLGAPTGIKALDREIGGYPFGDVAMIAARPGMGKTAAALAATAATVEAGFGVHVFAPEGGWRMYTDRLIALRARVPIKKLKSGQLSSDEASRISHAMMWYGRRNDMWHLDDRGGYTAVDIVRQVRKWRRKLKTRLVVVDYLQILKRRPGVSENDAIEEIVNVFGQVAPGDDIAWLLVSQLNRDVEKRPDKRPQMSDLRGSGALEQVARLIVFPYRGAYYYPEPREGIDYDGDHPPTIEQFQATVQLIVGKQNNGETGRVFANWNGSLVEMS
jgi:replicative DNA helicase